jgi:Tol biopolymer transport system component
MAILAAGLLAASCGTETEKQADAPFIGKHDVKVENGRMTPEVLWSFGRIGAAAISPDGAKLTYTVSYYSVEQNKSHTVIYVADADGQNAKMLTTSTKSESSPTWIKKGEKIAFLASDADGKSQIFEMSPDGSARKQLSFNEKDVEGFLFSPDET